MEIKTEIVKADDLMVGERGSIYGEAILQALELKKGEALKVTSPTNKHLRNTLHQLISRKGYKDDLGVVVSNKEVFIVKK